MWAKDAWQQRVLTTQCFLPNEEDKITFQVRQMRHVYSEWLQKQLIPERLQEIKEDETLQTAFKFDDDTMVDKLVESLNAEEDDRESLLEEFLEMWLKCEKDLWGGVIGWGEGRSCKQYLHSRALHERVRLEDFDEKGPGEEVFLLLHHNVHWVPARHQVSMGHTAAGPGFPRNPTKDFPRSTQMLPTNMGGTWTQPDGQKQSGKEEAQQTFASYQRSTD